MISSIEKEILIDILNNPGDTFYENVLSDFLDEQGIEHDFRKPLHNNLIIELKPYQEKYFDIWVNHWTNVGLCTKPTNENKAEQCFFDIYKFLGFSKPKNIIWFDNPIEMCNQTSGLYNQISNKLWSQLKEKLQNEISNKVSDIVNDQIYNQVWDRVYNQVWQVWIRLRDIVRDIVRDLTWDQVLRIQSRGELWIQLFYGQHDSHWLAFHAYCMQVLRMEASKSLILLILLAQEVNWWIPTEKTVYVTRKPKECIIKYGKLLKLVYQDNYTIT
jgi:hypothetical protein